MIFGTDDRKPVASFAAPYSGVVNLDVTFADGTRELGTGFLIDSRHVVTAAHLLYSKAHGGYAVTFSTGGVGAATLNVSLAYQQTEGVGVDYGLVTLASPVSGTPFRIGYTTDTEARWVKFSTAGYPGDLSGMYEASVLGASTVFTNSLRFTGTFDIFAGQSGSPVWQQRAGAAVDAVGLVVGESATDNVVLRFTDAQVRDLLTWDATTSTGNDTVIGTAGFDTRTTAASWATSTLLRNTDGTLTIANGAAGVDTFVGVERIHFTDGALRLDLAAGHGAQAYRLYQAALARQPDEGGMVVQANALEQFVAGMGERPALEQLARNFIGSAEFVSKYGASPTDGTYVDALYQNVLGRLPDAGGRAVQMNALATGLSREALLVNFSESAENVQLTGVATKWGLWLPIADPALG